MICFALIFLFHFDSQSSRNPLQDWSGARISITLLERIIFVSGSPEIPPIHWSDYLFHCHMFFLYDHTTVNIFIDCDPVITFREVGADKRSKILLFCEKVKTGIWFDNLSNLWPAIPFRTRILKNRMFRGSSTPNWNVNSRSVFIISLPSFRYVSSTSTVPLIPEDLSQTETIRFLVDVLLIPMASGYDV